MTATPIRITGVDFVYIPVTDGHALMLHHRYAPPEARPPGLEPTD